MANKKINQLVSKTSILSTDLFGIGDATTGQLFKKTIAELQAAIGGAVISVNGLVGTVVLDTDDIQELATPTNKYFTDARARGAISLTVTGNSGASTYSSGTGVLNVPTYTLAGLGGITASFLSGTSGISYNSTTGVISYSGTVYTDASIRALFSGSTGITYNSSTGAISYSGTVYTDSSVRALISMTTTGTSGASTYNNTTGVINVPDYTLAGLGGISLTSLSGGTGITYNSSTGAISYSGTVYTDASVRALISLTTTGTSGASTYNSTTGVLNIPQYQSALTNPVTGTGTSGYYAKFTSSTAIGNGIIYDDGTNISIGTTTALLSATNRGNLTLNGTTSSILTLGNGGVYSGYLFSDSTKLELSTNTQQMTFATNGVLRLTIASTGTATFTGNIISQGTYLDYQNTSYIRFSNSGGVTRWGYIQHDGTNMAFTNDISGGIFSFNKAATFSSSVTAGGNISITSSTGNRIGFNTPDSFSALGTTIPQYGLGYGWSTQPLGLSGYYGLSFFSEGSERMRITSAGKVGIGFTAPNYSLSVSGSINAGYVVIGDNTNSNNSTIEAVNSAGGTTYGPLHIQFYSGNYLSVCNGGGNLLVGGVTNNGEKLYVMGSIRATGSITANSDIALKKNLLKIENALEKVEQINGYTYELKEDDSKRHAGVIAQEIQTVLPEIVNKGNDGILGVEYGNISALLIEAIKEQNIKIKNLETLLASK